MNHRINKAQIAKIQYELLGLGWKIRDFRFEMGAVSGPEMVECEKFPHWKNPYLPRWKNPNFPRLKNALLSRWNDVAFTWWSVAARTGKADRECVTRSAVLKYRQDGS
ncbi:MAG: hypothetical protein U0892_21125 [Pirellulales bacterium]